MTDHDHLDDHDHGDIHDHLDAHERPLLDHDHFDIDDGEFDPADFAITHGSQLRTYQTVVAATGEYTAFHGGTKAAGQAAIVTAMNRVNQVYERDVAVRMVLVANNDDVVYTNSGSDPYTNNNGVAMLTENQSNVDAVIGSANYDVGHVFSTGGGGVASLGVIGQNGAKARGVTGLGSPIADPFWIDYVAHELGHQYGGNHTFNGDSGNCAGGNRNGSTAFEPGSGSTIQAYAGICGNDNIQNNSDDFFHSVSLEEIVTEITTGTGNSSATITNTGNSVPTVNAGLDYVIPARTPFELTAVGSDADGDTLTYSWEQRDLGAQRDVSASDNGSSPIFRAWDPTTNPTRTFPRLSDLLNNTTVIGEQLPTTDWASMDFEVVVRDNRINGGAIDSDGMSLQVVDTGAAFQVTSQNAATTWTGGTSQTVSWNVAGTTASPINAANVDILLSLDGGLTFNTVLAAGVPNDGSHAITVPNSATSQARFKVRGTGNVFFDINNANLTIVPGGPGVELTLTGGSTDVAEGGATDTYLIGLSTNPAGTVSITATADAQAELSLDGTTYSSSVVVVLNSTATDTIFVRAIDDTVDEGLHMSTITHAVTNTNDPTDYPISTLISDVVVTVTDNDQTDSILVGVDFDQAAGSNPSNWTELTGGNNTTVNNLIDENGQNSGFSLTVSETPDGSWQDFAAAPTASTIPQHPNNLANLDGQVYNGSDTFILTYSNLDPLQNYELYVFAIEGFFDSIQQRVTLQGDGAAVTFDQNFNQNDLFINDQIGDSTRSVSEYAQVITANASGQISITVAPLGGTSDVVLAGVAISEVPATGPLCDFDGDLDCDLADIDELVFAVVNGLTDLKYDLNGDNQITAADGDDWRALAGELNLGPGRVYLPADANLDSFVNGADYLTWNSNRFTSVAGWSAGDWNYDGIANGADFVIWNTFRFQSADQRGDLPSPTNRITRSTPTVRPTHEDDQEGGRLQVAQADMIDDIFSAWN